MSAVVRAVLFLAVVVVVGGVVFFAARPEPTPQRSVEPRAASLPEVSPAPETARPEPRKTAALEAAAPASSATEKPTEESLAASVHALEDSNPARALELSRQGLALWPNGPRAPEFAAAEVKSLYRLGRPSEGRGAAEAMVNKYPTSPWALEVEKQTGAHPYVNH